MAKREKKQKNSSGLAIAVWIFIFLVLLIVFLVKQDEIFSNLKTTQFFERLFGTTPEFIQNHEIKEKEPFQSEGQTVIELKTTGKQDKKDSKSAVLPQSPSPAEENVVPAQSSNSEKSALPEQPELSAENSAKPEKSANSENSEEAQKSDKTQNAEETVKAENTSKSEKSAASAKTEEKTENPVAKEKKMTSQKLYFVYIGEDGTLSRKMIVRSVEKNDSPLVTNINILLAGPNSQESAKGYRSLIPQGTKLLSASVRDGVAYLNFNEQFEFNTVGMDGYQAQLMQIVYTATEFSTVNSVQFLIEGQKKDYLGSDGMWIGSPLARSSFN